MTYGELFAMFLVIVVMMVGLNYMDKTRTDCKLKAMSESHLSVEAAKDLCSH